MDLNLKIQKLIDESEIREIISKYSRGVDRMDWDLLQSLYHDDAREEHGVYNGKVDGYIEWLKNNSSRQQLWMHVLALPIVEIEGDVAFTECYALAFCRMKDADPIVDLAVRVRYCDRFERRNGQWKIAHRKVVYEPGRIDPVGDEMAIDDQFLTPRADRTDPAYWSR